MAEELNLNLRPTYFNPEIDNGSETVYKLLLRDYYGKKQDLTGFTAKAELRPFPGSETVLDTLTTENGRLAIDLEESSITMAFPAKVTSKYTFPKACYDLLLIFNGRQWRIVQGAMVFRKEVTKNDD